MRDLNLRTPAILPPHLRGRHIIHLGSTSKTIWGGLRIGWIRAGVPLIRQLLRNRLQPVLSPPPFEQLVATRLLAEPSGLLEVRRTQLRSQPDQLAARLADSRIWSYTAPAGGLTMWCRPIV